jgi:hypothetical protein
MISLAGAIVALLLWFLLTFAVPVGLGAVHLLLAAGVVLLIRWWALRKAAGGSARGPARRSGSAAFPARASPVGDRSPVTRR